MHGVCLRPTKESKESEEPLLAAADFVLGTAPLTHPRVGQKQPRAQEVPTEFS